MIYLGGAVDVGDPELNHRWRHEGWEGLDTYCPTCACADLTNPVAILDRNSAALKDAADAVFVLGAFSVGTPIEAWHRITVLVKGGLIVWPFDSRSVFVEYMRLMGGAVVVSSLDEARLIIRHRAVSPVHIA